MTYNLVVWHNLFFLVSAATRNINTLVINYCDLMLHSSYNLLQTTIKTVHKMQSDFVCYLTEIRTSLEEQYLGKKKGKIIYFSWMPFIWVSNTRFAHRLLSKNVIWESVTVAAQLGIFILISPKLTMDSSTFKVGQRSFQNRHQLSKKTFIKLNICYKPYFKPIRFHSFINDWNGTLIS